MSEQKSKCCGAALKHVFEFFYCAECGFKDGDTQEEPPKKRKPVQIAGRDTALYALCDDGTMWELPHAEKGKSPRWNPLPNIPSQNDHE